MARVLIDGATMTVELQGLHRLWGLKQRITVPIAHVRGARVDPDVLRERKGLRAPGLGLGRLASIGTFYRGGQRHFWDVAAGGTPVVIELAGDHFDRLIVDVADPLATVAALNAALAPGR